jgi:D-tyrosyl-tRNA(Tyr) deacylase
MADKLVGLRYFEDAEGRTNLSIADAGGAYLVVSQFTLLADVRRGRRPGFTNAALPAVAEPLVERFVERLRSLGHEVATGRFGAEMEVELVNDGPFTLVLDSERDLGH